MTSVPGFLQRKGGPHFIYSGEVKVEELEKYQIMIKSLGGSISSVRNDQFLFNCTHILCFSFFSTVKIMCGLASGRWLVKKDYVEESYKAGKWLKEEAFEVSDYNQIAKFHRNRKKKLYSNLRCYIEVEQLSRTKSFKRILSAGGAITIEQNDHLKEHVRLKLAITDLASFPKVEDMVDKSTPILSVDYIKNTIFFKHDPLDIQKFLLNPKSVDLHNLDVSPKNREELSFFNKISRPLGAGGTPTTPTKSRIRRRTQTMKTSVSSNIYMNIASYFLKKESVIQVKSCSENKKPKIDYSYTNNEIQFIKEVKPAPRNKERLLIDSDDHPEVKEEYFEVKKNHLSRKKAISDFSSTESGGDGSRIVKCLDTASSQILSTCTKPFGIRTKPSQFLDEDFKKNSKTLVSSLMVEQTKSVLEGKESNVYALERMDARPQVDDPHSTPESTFSQDENIVEDKERERSVEWREFPQSIFKANKQKVLECKRATIIITNARMRKIISNFLIRLNTSFYYLSTSHIPIYPYPTLDIDVKELGSDESLYASTVEDENLHIISAQVGRHKIKIVDYRRQREPSTEDRLVALQSLEWLQLRIQPDIFPNATSLGAMLRSHILECPFKDVSDRALSILQRIINMHPPHNRRMRDYYLKVFEIASEEKEEGHSQFKGWIFVRRIILDLFEESPQIYYDVHTTIDCIIRLLELDLLDYNERPVSVMSLVSYRFWWVGVNQNPSVVNAAVKELVQLWIKSSEKDALTRRKVTKLVSIMLEMVWKWSDFSNPFLLAEWPMHNLWMPLANEIALQLKAKMESTCNFFLLVKYVKGPWQQMLLTSLAVRAISPTDVSLDLVLPSLKSALLKEIDNCDADNGKDRNSFHKLRVELLMLLIIAFVHSTGLKYCKETLTRQFIHSLKNKDVLRSHSGSLLEKEEQSLREETSPIAGETHWERMNVTTLHSVGHSGNKRNFDMSSSSCEDSDSTTSSTPLTGVEEQEEELNPAVKVMVESITKYFRLLPPFIKEVAAKKLKCAHLAKWQFHQAL